MVQRRIALTTYQPAKAGVRSFAILAAFEAAARSILISVYPVLMYRDLGDAKTVSEVYLLIGAASLIIALFTPMFSSLIPRRILYTVAACFMIFGNLIGLSSLPHAIPIAVLCNSAALVVMTVCFNAYVMDYIDRTSMGKNESSRLLYSGASWAIGPYLGVFLMDRWPAAPFIISIIAVCGLLAWFWYLRLGNGKVIMRAKKPATNPLKYLRRFFRQPSLVVGWLFAVMRSVGWAIYIIYLPIFAVESGLSNQAGGIALSFSNALLFLTPFMSRYLDMTSVRVTIMTGFIGSGVLFTLAAISTSVPLAAIGMLAAATLFLVLLDVSGGLPFLMTVKPSERTEMAAVYSTFRDVSAVVAPGFARVILIFTPLSGVFLAGGAVLLLCAGVAKTLHPRMGKKRISTVKVDTTSI